ncbi:MAG: hypothetical protein IJV70_07455 [Clostridia bacterium]|nr:hypothetical protein [Clostridia bacterium]
MLQEFPFIHLVVYNSIHETTYVYWELDSRLQDPGPYRFQLQTARTPNPSDEDWTNVGDEETDPAFLTDSETPSYGYRLDKYYRIILKTGKDTYISKAFGTFGQLRDREWQIAREIRRKERLRYGYTAVPVTILKKKSYGERCPVCSPDASEGSSNSHCEYCFGTGYLGGYCTPFTMQVMDISPSQLKEIHYSGNAATFNTAEDRYQARAAGVPELNEGDILIDHSTDQRFVVRTSPVIAQIHRVPLVRQVDMLLLPYSDIAYRIPNARQLVVGCGAVRIDQDYGGAGNLLFIDEHGEPIIGAEVRLLDESGEVLLITKTGPGGIWRKAFTTDPGNYSIQFLETGREPVSVPVVVSEEEALQNPDYIREQKEEQTDYLGGFF